MKKLLVLLVLLITSFSYASSPQFLVWDAPTTNTDGSPLTDLGGYKVYCGDSSGNYTIVKDIGLPLENRYQLDQILTEEKTYYCVMTAYDAAGNESDYSNEVSFPFVINLPNAPQNVRTE